MDALDQSIQFRLEWQYDIARMPAPVNHFMLQPGIPTQAGEVADVLLVLGYANPPAVIQTPEGTEILSGPENTVPVHPVGHFTLPAARAVELRDLLNAWIENGMPVHGNTPPQ